MMCFKDKFKSKSEFMLFANRAHSWIEKKCSPFQNCSKFFLWLRQNINMHYLHYFIGGGGGRGGSVGRARDSC